MAGRKIVFCCALGCSLLVVMGAMRVSGRDGKKAGPLVERIDFEGMRCVSVERVRGKVRTKQDAPYDAAVAESDAKRLRDTGNYRRVAVHVEDSADRPGAKTCHGKQKGDA